MADLTAFGEMRIKLTYDSSVSDGEVEDFIYKLKSFLKYEAPFPPAGVSVDDIIIDKIKLK